jgi:hypothetical protein
VDAFRSGKVSAHDLDHSGFPKGQPLLDLDRQIVNHARVQFKRHLVLRLEAIRVFKADQGRSVKVDSPIIGSHAAIRPEEIQQGRILG